MSRLITGLQPVREAIRVHGERLERVLVEERGGPQIEAVARFATDRGATVARVTRGDLDRASKGARHQGAIAYAPDLAIIGIDDLATDLASDAVIVALDETFRASAGAVEHARLCRVGALPSALERLHAAGAAVVGLDANADKDIRDVSTDGPVVLVIGAEGKGLRKPVKRACTELARLPMSGVLDSLNASVAGGIALYELLRRRPR